MVPQGTTTVQHDGDTDVHVSSRFVPDRVENHINIEENLIKTTYFINIRRVNMEQLPNTRLMSWQLELDQQETRNTLIMAEAKTQQRKNEEKIEKTTKTTVPVSRKKRRSIWVRDWFRRRPDLGQYSRLIQELKKEYVKGFRNFLQMDYMMYKEILQRITKIQALL